MANIHEGNFKAHLATLTLAQLRQVRATHTLSPAQLAYQTDAQLTQYNHVLDLIDEAIEQQAKRELKVDYTGVISLRHASHSQLVEKMLLFAELMGRQPRLTVCPHGKITFYAVLKVLDEGLVIEIHKHSQTTVAPVDGVYDAVSLF